LKKQGDDCAADDSPGGGCSDWQQMSGADKTAQRRADLLYPDLQR